MDYRPPQDVLDTYAKVLIDFALGNGAGIYKGDVVCIRANDYAKPLFIALHNAVIRSGGHVIPEYSPAAEEGLNLRFGSGETRKRLKVIFLGP